jgi:hypothetical protein
LGRTTKSRALPYSGDLAGDFAWKSMFFGSVRNSGHEYNQPQNITKLLTGSQTTDSETHPGWKTHTRGSFKGDIGGEFSSVRRYVSTKGNTKVHIEATVDEGDGWSSYVNYNGPFLAIGPANLDWAPWSSSSSDDLDEMGTAAIARISPSNPAVDLTTALGELLKDGLPKLAGSTLMKLRHMTNRQRSKALSDEYLNNEFGIQPIVNDITDFSNRIVMGDRIINQYTRDSGKLVRRSFEFPTIRSTTSDVVSGPPANPWVSPSTTTMYDIWASNTGRVIRTHDLVQRRWFKGAFTYYVPPPDGSLKTDLARQVILAKKSLGIRFTPDAIWNLAPWSWAIDWFVNVDDLLTNFANYAIDGQVLAYGYMMEHTISTYTYTFTGSHSLRTGEVPASVVLTSETKTRRKATPYGFGLTWDGFSAFQKSIIAALGLSKGFGKK